MRTLTLHAHDPKFPPQLRYKRGPVMLEAIGPLGHRLDALGPTVAIVGTRSPPRAAWRYAYWLAAVCARAGATIVSGGAYGVDAAAHEGALSVGGKTLAILPGSIDDWQPAGNSALFRRIERGGGALVAFLPRGAKPRYHERNAAIAALSDDVVVVAAPLESGARNTAREARARDRRLWVVPGSPWDDAMSGCAIELAEGAQVLVSPEPILSRLGVPAPFALRALLYERPWDLVPDDPNPRPETARAPSSDPTVVTQRTSRASLQPTEVTGPARTLELAAASPEERRLFEALQKGPKSVDQLCLETALPVTRLAGILLTWTVEGVLREGPPGLYRLITS